MSIPFCIFAVEIRTRYNKLSALPKHGNRHTMTKDHYTYKATPNYRRRTYTIRVYLNGKLYRKYRTLPQADEVHNCLTENDIKYLLRSRYDYFEVRGNYMLAVF